MKKTFLILTFLLMSSILVIGQNTFSTGNMGKFFRVGSNFRYLPYAGLHYSMVCDSVIFTKDGTFFNSANISSYLWESILPGSLYIIPKDNRGIIGDTIFSSDSVPILRCYTTNRNVFLGYGTAYDKRITGTHNTFIGFIAGRDMLTGTNNTFIGERSGSAYTSGSYNIFIGQNSGSSGGGILSNRLGIGSMDWMGIAQDTANHIIWGIQDIVSSNQFLWLNANTKVKHSLMVYNEEILDYDTVFLKNDTLDILATKSDLNNNKSLWENDTNPLFIKPKSNKSVILDSLFDGDLTRNMKIDALNNNVFLGYASGMVTYGLDNVIIGINTGSLNTSGAGNTLIGTESGAYNINGMSNTFIGTRSGSNNNGSNNIFIGSMAGFYLTGKNNKFIVNSFDQTNSLNDTANSLMVGDFNLDPSLQKLDINAKVRIGYSLTIAGDTAATKPFVDSKYLQKSDTTNFLHFNDTILKIATKSDLLGISGGGGNDTATTYNGVYLQSVHGIYFEGNSLTYEGTYPARVKALLGEKWFAVNVGINGSTTQNVIDRFAADITSHAECEYMVLEIGINDVIGGIAAATIESNIQYLITTAHNAGIKVIMQEITPCKGYSGWSSAKQIVLDEVNYWINNTAINIDDIIHSYSFLEDPSNPDYLLPAFDGGDGLHLSSSGYSSWGSITYSGATYTPRTTFGSWLSIKVNSDQILTVDAYNNTLLGKNISPLRRTGMAGNTAMGNYSLNSNYTGTYNTSIGFGSGMYLYTGNYNNHIGYYAGRSNDGNYNNFIGYYSAWWSASLSNWTILNTRDCGSASGDTTLSTIATYQGAALTANRIRLNGNVNISNSLTIGGYNALTTSDTTSLLLGKPRASQIYSTIADRIAGDKWGLVAAGSGYIQSLNSKKIIATTFYTTDSLDIFNVSATTNNLFIGRGGKRDLTGTGNIIFGDVTTGDALTSSSNNVIIGTNSGSSVASGTGNNTFIGSYSGYSVTGAANTYIGYSAGKYMTSENNRIIIDNRSRGNKLGDSTLSATYIYTAVAMGDQIFYHNGNVVYTPINTGNVVDGTGITRAMLSATIIYNGDSPIDITANPQIVAGKQGQRIMIIGTSDTNTLTLDNGNGIVCPSTRILGINDIVQYVYTGSSWVEFSYTNN